MVRHDRREFNEYARTLSRRELIEQSLKVGLTFGALGAPASPAPSAGRRRRWPRRRR